MVRSFLGGSRVDQILAVASASSAGNANARNGLGHQQCAAAFPADGCPWSPAASKRILAKVIMNSDLDLGTMAAMAMQGAKAFA